MSFKSPEARREYARRWAAEDRKKDPEKSRARQREHYHKHKDKTRATRNERARIYGRKGVEPTRPCPERCEVCDSLPGKKSLSMDHCHLTGVFRGWLCSNCNTALGLLKESSDRCVALARYIRGHQL
jgi:hypothetical protein